MREFDIKDGSWITYESLQSHLMQIFLTLKLLKDSDTKKVLEIGPGRQFVSSILKQYCNLKTLDSMKEYNPDLLIDITDLKELNKIKDESFDLILLCEVLEHIPYEKLDKILAILRNKTRKYIVISVPNQYTYLKIILFKYGLDSLKIRLLKKILFIFSEKIGKIISLLDYRFRKKYKTFKFQGFKGNRPRHYWELGINKYSINSFKKLLEKYFIIINNERVKEQPFHHFFILKIK